MKEKVLERIVKVRLAKSREEAKKMYDQDDRSITAVELLEKSVFPFREGAAIKYGWDCKDRFQVVGYDPDKQKK